jgi:hypothetical protein
MFLFFRKLFPSVSLLSIYQHANINTAMMFKARDEMSWKVSLKYRLAASKPIFASRLLANHELNTDKHNKAINISNIN